MERTRLYELLEKAKYGNDLTDHVFQVDKSWDKFNGANLSGLFSLLIKEAGRLCDSYASDVFYNMKAIEKALYGKDAEIMQDEVIGYYTVVGFRDSGVDGESYMIHTSDTFAYRYREILYIKVEWNDDKHMTMKLSTYKVDIHMMDFYNKMD